jgi:hypothetical protein
MRTIKIWMLEDYEREVWSFKYNIELPVEYFSLFEYRPYLVLSNKGDVLIYYPSIRHMFHYDNTGKLLEKFSCDSVDLSTIGHLFKESLVKHDISLRRGSARLFQRL